MDRGIQGGGHSREVEGEGKRGRSWPKGPQSPQNKTGPPQAIHALCAPTSKGLRHSHWNTCQKARRCKSGLPRASGMAPHHLIPPVAQAVQVDRSTFDHASWADACGSSPQNRCRNEGEETRGERRERKKEKGSPKALRTPARWKGWPGAIHRTFFFCSFINSQCSVWAVRVFTHFLGRHLDAVHSTTVMVNII